MNSGQIYDFEDYKNFIFLQFSCVFHAVSEEKNKQINNSILLHRKQIIINTFFMKKTKLSEVRNAKRIPQEQVAEYLNISPSCYSRRENGQIFIKEEEWKKLAEFLNVPVDEIYEPDGNQSIICNDNASANVIGTNFGPYNVYTVQEALLEAQQKHIETQQKYIAKLEAEIEEYKTKVK